MKCLERCLGFYIRLIVCLLTSQICGVCNYWRAFPLLFRFGLEGRKDVRDMVNATVIGFNLTNVLLLCGDRKSVV